MPLQNRVMPTGNIVKSNSRGTFMGNRGVLHNAEQHVTRLFKNKAWITCSLNFKGRQRELMSPGGYTELFFLDEVTAFAAGHRPCAECRRARYNEFRDFWGREHPPTEKDKVSAPQLDAVLHEERIADGEKVVWREHRAKLPHGAVFRVGEDHFAVHDNEVLRWSFDGYSVVLKDQLPENVEVLTPRSVVQVFAAGFRPEFHSSAAS